MLKLVYCLARRPEMSREEFQDYWRNTHAPLVAAASEALGIRHYVQCHTAQTGGDNALRASRGLPAGAGEADYDGVAELWFDSEEAIAAGGTTEEGRRHGAILAEDEARFIDFGRSRIFLSQENCVIGGELVPAKENVS